MSDFSISKIEIRNSPVHGSGIFARVDILAGTRICNYNGELISTEKAERRTEQQFLKNPKAPIYIFEIDDETYIDATDTGAENPARFINHSCNENCEVILEAQSHVLEVHTLRDIPAGEELSIDYGFGLIGFFEHPCRCGAKNCVGYIVARPLRPRLLKKLAAKYRTHDTSPSF